MAVPVDWGDDERVLELLREALGEEREVPPSVVEAGKALYTWRSVDAELAALTYDSYAAPAPTRVRSAPIRELTFTSRHLLIQVQVTATSLQGQVVPPQRGQVEVHVEGRPPVVVEIDQDGWFSVDRIGGDRFRLVCRTADGLRAITDPVPA